MENQTNTNQTSTEPKPKRVILSDYEKILKIITKIQSKAKTEGKKSVAAKSSKHKSETRQTVDRVAKKLSDKIEKEGIRLHAQDGEDLGSLIDRLKAAYGNEVVALLASQKPLKARDFDKILYNCLIMALTVSDKAKSIKPQPKAPEPTVESPPTPTTQ